MQACVRNTAIFVGGKVLWAAFPLPGLLTDKKSRKLAVDTWAWNQTKKIQKTSPAIVSHGNTKDGTKQLCGSLGVMLTYKSQCKLQN